MKRSADNFEGGDIMFYLEREMEGLKDDELTKGRIRTIYVKVRYGHTSIKELAEYYDLPPQVIRDIASGKLFSTITQDL